MKVNIRKNSSNAKAQEFPNKTARIKFLSIIRRNQENPLYYSSGAIGFTTNSYNYCLIKTRGTIEKVVQLSAEIQMTKMMCVNEVMNSSSVVFLNYSSFAQDLNLIWNASVIGYLVIRNKTYQYLLIYTAHLTMINIEMFYKCFFAKIVRLCTHSITA